MQLDNLFNVQISEDRMAAEIVLVAEVDDLTLVPEDVISALQKQGITYGFDQQAIQELCRFPKKFVNIPLVIARGKPPVPGIDGRIEYAFQDGSAADRKPKLLDDGRVDYYTVSTIANVSRGQLLATKHPPVKGVEGVTVTGETVTPPGGKEVVIKQGKNVVLNEDKTRLYAAIDGQVSVTENEKINVFPVYEINGDVDFNVGNIDFVGTVVIRGNIPTGFRVKASGDIRVYGSVEGAELEAGGSIEIKSGIAAQDKGFVQAGVNVVSSYIQNGHVSAGNEVIVTQSIMFSQVRAGKNIICIGPKGSIIGGKLQAGEKIVARVIGSPSSTPTVLEVGAKPELRQELQQITKDLQGMYDNLRKTDQALAVLSQILQTSGALPPDKKAMQIRLTNNRLALEKEIKQLESRKQEVETELEGDSPALVEVRSIMYPGIKLVFGKLVRFIKQEHSRTRFLVLGGDITSSPLL